MAFIRHSCHFPTKISIQQQIGQSVAIPAITLMFVSMSWLGSSKFFKAWDSRFCPFSCSSEREARGHNSLQHARAWTRKLEESRQDDSEQRISNLRQTKAKHIKLRNQRQRYNLPEQKLPEINLSAGPEYWAEESYNLQVPIINMQSRNLNYSGDETSPVLDIISIQEHFAPAIAPRPRIFTFEASYKKNTSINKQ